MFGRNKRIYLDYASATPVAMEAARAMERAKHTFANPGAMHREGVAAKLILTDARERIASHLGCKAREVIFTSGLTEANAIAIVGTARSFEFRHRSLRDTHWIVSSIEHSSVLECFAEVERLGGAVSHVDPGPQGVITPELVAEVLRPDTVFISIGWANNEIGIVQRLREISRILHAHERAHGTQVLFHSDAGQAPLYRSPQVHTLGVDMLALGSGKLYGPPGIGCLYVSNRCSVAPVKFGGAQERGLRPGTEDPALAAGFAEALDTIASEREREARRLRELRDGLARDIAYRVPGLVVNGDIAQMLPHMLNISIPGKKNGEFLVLSLDYAGVALSTKSACREGEARSHVVAALGGESWRAENTLRISLGRGTTARDLARAADILAEIQ